MSICFMNLFKRKPKSPPIITNENGMFFARLLFDEPLNSIEQDAIHKELQPLFSSFNSDAQKSHKSVQYFFKDYPVTFAEGIIPGQGVIILSDKKSALSTDLTKLYAQQWHWEEAQGRTNDFKSELLVNDLMSRPLPYIKRVEMFQKLVYATSKALRPIAIYFPTSEKIVPTDMYIKQIDADGFTSLFGLVNVRFFSINEDNTNFMDTVGLHTLGLPDFQIRYTDLKASDVGGMLYSYADYIYKNGSVILNGNTIEGVEADSIWECVYQGASLAPKRNVLHVNIRKNKK